MEIMYDRLGSPVAWIGSKSYGEVTSEYKQPHTPHNTFYIGDKEYVSWGATNKYPDDAVDIISSTGVLQTAIGYKVRVAYGLGVVPMQLSGLDDNGDEMLVPVNDMELISELKGYQIRRYLQSAIRDIIKVGNCFPLFSFSSDGRKIVSCRAVNARHCRISKDKAKLCIYPDFNQSSPSQDTAMIVDMLDEDAPDLNLEALRLSGKLAGKMIAYPRIKNILSNNDYYGYPDWEASYRSGWIDVAHKIPTFLSHAYANAMNIMWHIRVPKEYYDSHFPIKEFPNVEERKKKIQEWMKSMEDNLCGVQNANKALFTDFSVNANGKAEEKWDIERVKNEIDAEERLSTSAAANSEILFSMMVNPSVLGAGMPGGSYAGTAGSGSDIREAFWVTSIVSQIEKEQVIDPIKTMLNFNGYKNIELKYRQVLLTTLNTGQSTKEGLE
jgi:hypothetical protein